MQKPGSYGLVFSLQETNQWYSQIYDIATNPSVYFRDKQVGARHLCDTRLEWLYV